MNKPKRNRRNYIVKPKVSKKLVISAVASVMAVTIATSLVWNAMKVSVPVEANTLSGVDAALKDHGSGDSFVILNIVPGTGETDEGLPLGTFGNLTIGQSPLELKLAKMFEADAKKYISYTEREKAASGYNYEESLTGGNGWTKIYDGEAVVVTNSSDGEDFDSIKNDLHRTKVRGTATKQAGGAYVLAESLKEPVKVMVADDIASYSLAEGPVYEGYRLVNDTVVEIDESYSEENDTIIYRIEDGKYKYCGTIGEVVARRNRWKEYEEECIKYEEEYAKYEEELAEYDKQVEQFNKAWDEYNAKLKEWELQNKQPGDENKETPDSEGTGNNGTDDDGEGGEGTGNNGTGGDGEGSEGTDNNGTDNNGTGGDGEGGEGTDNNGTGGDGEGGEGTDNNGTGNNGTGGDGESGEGTGNNGTGGDGESGEGTGNNGTGGDGESGEGTGNDITETNELFTSLGWMKFIGEEPAAINSEETISETTTTSETDAETSATPSDEAADKLLEKPEEPDIEMPEKPVEPEKPEELEEPEEEEFEYRTVEFEYERANSKEKPIEGLYIPDKFETVLYEESEAAVAFAAATLSDDSEDSEEDGNTTDDTIEKSFDLKNTLVYVGPDKGEYTITMGGKDSKELLVYSAPTYFRCNTEDLFKEHVLGNDGINIKVVVKSAAAVSLNDVSDADLIYLEDASIVEGDYIYKGSNDMLDSVVYSIIDRAVNDMTPVIVDYNVSKSDQYSDTNYQKLANILLMTDLYSFYQDFEDNVTNMLMNSYTGDYGRSTDTDKNYVSNNIYVCSEVFTNIEGDFTKEFEDMEGFEAVKSTIDMENRQGNDLPQPSKAMAIQYIINYANGFIGEFRDFAILELQPTSSNGEHDLQTRDDKRNNTILYWKRPGSSSTGQQLLRSRKSIDITIDTESVAQFVGEQSDINDKYQMIFIGLDGKNLYYNSGETVYNNSDMNGLVYSSVGDRANGEENYEGIDITPQKKEALLNFMRAGYPVVVENNFFKDKTAKDAKASDIDTAYIASSSNMYKFLQEALSEEWGRYCLYTIADVHLYSSDFAAQINAHRPRIEFDTDNEICNINPTYAQLVQTVSADAVDGKYRGYIAYKVTNDIGEYYDQSWNLRFYLDMNQDGRFDDTEDVTNDVAISNGVLMVEFAAPERGSIPWKLEVSDEGNRYRRDDLTGYFNIYHSTQLPIRIVQVIGADDPNNPDASFNLQAAYEIIPDQALIGYYLKNAEALTNTEFDISTITVGQLAAELKDNVEYLSGVDVLVLGFGPDYSMSVPVEGTGLNVDWFVNKYISEGRGVLVSSAASSASSGRLQLDVGALGQKDAKTYNSLGRTKPSDFNYKYSNLESGMFDEWGSLSASRVNDGAISHYPYEIGVGVQLGGGNVKIADYVLDLENNGQSGTAADVTAWYTLGNSMGAKTSYGASVNDAANNYYIYSKGNVVYVGSNSYPYVYDGTGGIVPADDTEGIDDCKLFVNALMEAYTVGIKNPKATIVAGLSDDSAEADSICIPYDEQIREIEESEGALNSKGVLDDTVDVYFKISDPNFAFKKDVQIFFYYEDNIAGEQVNVGGRMVNATQFTSEVWTVDQNQLVPVDVNSGLDYVPGKVYKIKAPVVSLKNDDNSVKADIYIVVQSHFIKLGQDRHPIGSDSVILNRAQLFLLE